MDDDEFDTGMCAHGEPEDIVCEECFFEIDRENGVLRKQLERAEAKLRLAMAVVDAAREGFRAEREEYESAAIHRAWKALKESIRAFDGTEGSDDKDT